MKGYSLSAYDLPSATRKTWDEINGGIYTVKMKDNIS